MWLQQTRTFQSQSLVKRLYQINAFYCCVSGAALLHVSPFHVSNQGNQERTFLQNVEHIMDAWWQMAPRSQVDCSLWAANVEIKKIIVWDNKYERIAVNHFGGVVKATRNVHKHKSTFTHRLNDVIIQTAACQTGYLCRKWGHQLLQITLKATPQLSSDGLIRADVLAAILHRLVYGPMASNSSLCIHSC